jgi:2-polyprenyl-3-methyl-5-hydroxy-6-metoxy-1,4-benzoquinol methylase
MEIQNNVCPWWLGYTFLIPFRKFQHDPYKILGPHVKEGMTVMDYGCAMGYFSLPLAKMTGKNGNVYCVDIQEKMLENLQRRAANAQLEKIIKPRLVGKTFNVSELENKLDFVLIFMVVHEVPDKKQLFLDLFKMVKPGGKVLFAEPKGHVKPVEFEKSLQLAEAAGFKVSDEKPMRKGLCVFLEK